MKKALKGTIGGLAAALAVAQFVPVDRTNPPVTGTVDAPEAVLGTLRRSCFDCHSHETRWPWYARVAPASWLVAHDVKEAREHVNFSTWGELNAEDRAHALEEIVEVMEDEEMPLGIYTLVHPEAKLSRSDRARLVEWAQGAGAVADGRPAP